VQKSSGKPLRGQRIIDLIFRIFRVEPADFPTEDNQVGSLPFLAGRARLFLDLGQADLAIFAANLFNRLVSAKDEVAKMLACNGSHSAIGRGVVLATLAVLVVTISEPPSAVAAPASKGVSATTVFSDATDFSSARRRRHYRRGDAAGLAFFGMALGTMAAIAAQQNYGYGYGPYYYGGGPYYYGGGPYYYGDGPYYGRRYYYRPY
jgi:hypothetical protein